MFFFLGGGGTWFSDPPVAFSNKDCWNSFRTEFLSVIDKIRNPPALTGCCRVNANSGRFLFGRYLVLPIFRSLSERQAGWVRMEEVGGGGGGGGGGFRSDGGDYEEMNALRPDFSFT